MALPRLGVHVHSEPKTAVAVFSGMLHRLLTERLEGEHQTQGLAALVEIMLAVGMTEEEVEHGFALAATPQPEEPAYRVTTCGTCGVPVIYAEITKQDGTEGRVPLDPKPPIYVLERNGRARRAPQKAEARRRVLVSHFATCKAPPKKGRRSSS